MRPGTYTIPIRDEGGYFKLVRLSSRSLQRDPTTAKRAIDVIPAKLNFVLPDWIKLTRHFSSQLGIENEKGAPGVYGCLSTDATELDRYDNSRVAWWIFWVLIFIRANARSKHLVVGQAQHHSTRVTSMPCKSPTTVRPEGFSLASPGQGGVETLRVLPGPEGSSKTLRGRSQRPRLTISGSRVHQRGRTRKPSLGVPDGRPGPGLVTITS